MSKPVISAQPSGSHFAHLRAEFDLSTEFPAAAIAEAQSAASGQLSGQSREDATDLPLVTIDPPGAKDLDQALLVQRQTNGFRVHYAIADLGPFITPGGALDTEARKRGQTMYLPDGNIPLHPHELSEGAASLLPLQVRPAVLWTFDCDPAGEPVNVRVRRAMVRSVAQFDYAGVHAALLRGNPHRSLAAFADFGRARRQLAAERGAVELQLPEQEIIPDDHVSWKLALRPRSDIDAWNAEISLLTGMCAADIMLTAKIGILRTLTGSGHNGEQDLRKTAHALGISWPDDASPTAVLASLDPARPESLALFMDATRLLRGAGYTSFDGQLPEHTTHAGIAAPYTHVTAPLRRLVDRFTAEICLSVTAGKPVPDWVRAELPELPELMHRSDALANRVDRACLDQVESWVLADRIGAEFAATVLRSREDSADVFLADPPIMGRCVGVDLPEGGQIRVRLTQADPVRRNVLFEPAG